MTTTITTNLDVTCSRGARVEVPLVLQDAAGNPVDVSGFTFTGEVRDGDPRRGEFNASALVTLDADQASASAGLVTFVADAAALENVPDGDYRWDVRAVNASDGDDVRYPITARVWRVVGTVTRAA